MRLERFNSHAGIYYRKIQIYMKKAFKRLGISFDEGIILQYLLANPGVTQDHIAEALALDAAAVARSLKAMEQRGYLLRSVDETNQRRKLTNVTPAGAQVANRIIQAMDAWDNEIFKGLSDERVAVLVESTSFLQRRAQEIDISSLFGS